ncbi:hypothetical protein C7C46_04825 [Streptomyces tateyamensis]|uniref:Thiaminase-2/PQQC domain-containing protein n=1 Tax=Streptomyces tateyamensis TaxID=565073 RepID=A0A2V4PR17_9ACTN|nr:hypothetical protein [Streptomyces tateyamensis]PYC87407.1 hypothetical protein C7C46_04825 [Streptomyces tateyamensis]
MVEVIDSAVRPRFSRDVSLTTDGELVRIEDGTYRAAFPSSAVTLADLERWAAGGSPAELLADVRGWLDCPEPRAREVVERLFSTGLLVDPEAARLDSVPGAYVACRLVDAFRREFPRVLRDAPLLRALAAGPDHGLAAGLLLETYFVVRAASWSAEPVFRHRMTAVQRAALEEFRASESGHGNLLLGGFAALGLDVDVLRTAEEAVETMAYSHAYGAFGWQGVAEFAAALILPEVRAAGADSARPGTDVLDLLEREHGIPEALIRRFRAHDADDVEGDHGGLPSLLLSEEHELGQAKVTRLFTVLRQMMDLYRGHLDAVHRRYARWLPGEDPTRQLPDNAYRF